MAAKKKSVKKKKSSPRKSITMSTPKRKKRKSTALSTHRRAHRAIAVPRRRKRKGLSGAGAGLKTNAIHTGAALMGGAGYGGAVHVLNLHEKNHWVKAAVGTVASMGTAMMGMQFVAAGIAGAAGSDLAKTLLEHGLHDGEMSDVEYVHPSTLSDSGILDDHGNMMLMDADGICYAPDEEGTYHAMGDVYALHENSNMQNVSMLPLMDHGHNPYNLGNQY